tara:strand:- start:374 stop:601 length:228 start_codon:yes stop_codon:yes gene_type:complete
MTDNKHDEESPSASAVAVAKFRAKMRDEGFRKVEAMLAPDTIAALDKIGQAEDRSRAWLLKRAVQDFIDRYNSKP